MSIELVEYESDPHPNLRRFGGSFFPLRLGSGVSHHRSPSKLRNIGVECRRFRERVAADADGPLYGSEFQRAAATGNGLPRAPTVLPDHISEWRRNAIKVMEIVFD
jgi:hypothetical protein